MSVISCNWPDNCRAELQRLDFRQNERMATIHFFNLPRNFFDSRPAMILT
jgi:hypothetical protein